MNLVISEQNYRQILTGPFHEGLGSGFRVSGLGELAFGISVKWTIRA